jgi:hypothetical protein
MVGMPGAVVTTPMVGMPGAVVATSPMPGGTVVVDLTTTHPLT